MNDIRVVESESIQLKNPTFKDRVKTKWMKNKKKIKNAVVAGTVDAAMVGGVNVAVQEAYKPEDYYDLDFDVFENLAAKRFLSKTETSALPGRDTNAGLFFSFHPLLQVIAAWVVAFSRFCVFVFRSHILIASI